MLQNNNNNNKFAVELSHIFDVRRKMFGISYIFIVQTRGYDYDVFRVGDRGSV